jgi:hypothetical protein
LKVINVHRRIIHQPKGEIDELIKTLATENDKVWPFEKWPKMIFKDGIKVGSHGRHGPIQYVINEHVPGELIQFQFTNPSGFDGIHKFEIIALAPDQVELTHTIDMITSGSGTLKWILGIRWLHDALLEDLLDKIENQFDDRNMKTKWNLWVIVLRKVLG